ncbi:hypothetical protein G7Y79_00023g054740 [Physcia stellaris]|nr:hypothetical protein G7Y79_00023g054740 [Physcia stellaris]
MSQKHVRVSPNPFSYQNQLTTFCRTRRRLRRHPITRHQHTSMLGLIILHKQGARIRALTIIRSKTNSPTRNSNMDLQSLIVKATGHHSHTTVRSSSRACITDPNQVIKGTHLEAIMPMIEARRLQKGSVQACWAL